MAFVKLDTGILDSTLWIERDLREVFITALLMAEPREFGEPQPQIKIGSLEPTGFEAPPGWYGFVAAASLGIINRASVEREPGMEALRKLGEPEIESRSKEFEGRRMIRVNGGFLILNYMKYRDKDHSAAERQRNLRARRKTGIDSDLKVQNYRCACCEAGFEQPYNLYVVQDHDHKTKENRGLVCQSCNKVIGQIELQKKTDSPKASLCLNYLKRYGVTFGDNGVTLSLQSRNVTQSDSREQNHTKNKSNNKYSSSISETEKPDFGTSDEELEKLCPF